MKRKKMAAGRLLAWVMIMVLLAACMSEMTPAQASAEKTSGYFKYVLLDDGTVMITGITYSAVMSIQRTRKITIPGRIDEYAVTQLGELSMSRADIQNYLRTVIISEGITTIGTKAFYALTSLSSVSLPSTLRVMNDQCFSQTALVSVTIPAGVERYGLGVFAFCKSLETVIVSKGVESLGPDIFQKCTALKNVQLSASMKEFGDYAFAQCTALEEIDIPSSVEVFGPGSFFQTKWLDTKRQEREDHLVIVNDIVIDGYLCTGDIVVPEGVKAIAAAAFAYGIKDKCAGAAVSSISLPSSVASIGRGAFYDCPNLVSIRLPEGLSAIPDMLLGGCSSLKELVLPGTVAYIGDSAFAGCTSLTKLTLSDSLEEVEPGSIPEGQGLVLVIPERLTDIRNLGLENLSGVVFNVVEGGSVANYLTQNNITNYTVYAASEPGVAEETPKPSEETPKPAEETPKPSEETPKPSEETPNPSEEPLKPSEETPKSSEETSKPSEETSKPSEETPGTKEEQKSQEIHQDSYEKGKVYVVAKKRYRIISRKTVAFVGCANASVRKLTVPASIQLGSKTYRVTAIAADACKGSKKLQRVIIGKNVKTVGAAAFRNCKKLTRLTYGAGVVEIQKNGLRGDISLKTVTIKSRKLKRMGKAVFRQVPSSLTVKVPKNKLAKYKKMIRAAR